MPPHADTDETTVAETFEYVLKSLKTFAALKDRYKERIGALKGKSGTLETERLALESACELLEGLENVCHSHKERSDHLEEEAAFHEEAQLALATMIVVMYMYAHVSEANANPEKEGPVGLDRHKMRSYLRVLEGEDEGDDYSMILEDLIDRLDNTLTTLRKDSRDKHEVAKLEEQQSFYQKLLKAANKKKKSN